MKPTHRVKHPIPIACLLFALALFLSADARERAATRAAWPAADDERLLEFEQRLEALRQTYNLPGLSAVIVSNQRIIWEKGFGFQDIENRIPATPDTPYHIASLTKTFASMLLMKCVEQSGLNLNDPINRYTAQITQPGVSVRHVFTHTSESAPPGEQYNYNGNRYGALTPVVDACAGQSFRVMLARTILDRLEMWDSAPAALATVDGVNHRPVGNPDGTPNPLKAGDFLILFGTGIRGAAAGTVKLSIGGVDAPTLYAGKQPDFVGLDQVNAQIPAGLSGEVVATLSINGRAANPVRLLISP